MNYGDGETQSYGFDPMGNRTSKSDTAGGTTTNTGYTYDAANRLASTANNGASASAVTSDADGNTLTDTSGRTMTWDSQNRLASCTKGGVTSTFTYGADGLRRSSTVNGVTTLYAYDGQTLIREMKRNVNTGQLMNTATYLQGPGGGECRVDETQVTENYVNSLTGSSGVRGQTSWYVYDGLGSVQDELRITGAASGGNSEPYSLTPSAKYDVYGAARAGATGAVSRQGFVGGLGHVSDTETGLIYMRARYYDPALGRFASEDPAGHGTNWYVYCSNNPTSKIDADGKVDWPVIPPTVFPPPPDVEYVRPDLAPDVDKFIMDLTEIFDKADYTPMGLMSKLAAKALDALNDAGEDEESGEALEFNLEVLKNLSNVFRMTSAGATATEESYEEDAVE